VIALDADVLCIYHVFKRDNRYDATAAFVQAAIRTEAGVPIFAVLELCGVVATAHQPREARDLFEEYATAGNLTILYPPVELVSTHRFWAEQTGALLSRIGRGFRLGDAAILWTVESTGCEVLITWNKRHYEGKTTIKVQTPQEWLAEQGI